MKNWLLKTVTGAIIIAIIGSAVWENIVKPSSGWFLKLLVNITTLGIKSFQNSIYTEIAKGFHDDISLKVMFFVYGTLLCMVSATFFISYFRRTKTDESVKKIIRSKIFATLFFMIVAFFAILDLSRTVYVNQAVAYFFQLEKIDAPYMTDEQSKLLESRFAQIRNADDYITITTELEKDINLRGQVEPKKPSILMNI